MEDRKGVIKRRKNWKPSRIIFRKLYTEGNLSLQKIVEYIEKNLGTKPQEVDKVEDYERFFVLFSLFVFKC